jgi:hypothetical protein
LKRRGTYLFENHKNQTEVVNQKLLQLKQRFGSESKVKTSPIDKSNFGKINEVLEDLEHNQSEDFDSPSPQITKSLKERTSPPLSNREMLISVS